VLTSATKSLSKKAIKSALLNLPNSLAAASSLTEMKSKAKLPMHHQVKEGDG
jgi:hypothetical protein